jgi:hypothetical protein
VTVLAGADHAGTTGGEGSVDALVADDRSGANFWLGHLQAGVLLYGGATLLGAGSLLLTPDGPTAASSG